MMMNNFTIYKITFSKSKWIEGVKKEKISSQNHDTRLFSENRIYNESISFDNYCFFFLIILNLLSLFHRPALWIVVFNFRTFCCSTEINYSL